MQEAVTLFRFLWHGVVCGDLMVEDKGSTDTGSIPRAALEIGG